MNTFHPRPSHTLADLQRQRRALVHVQRFARGLIWKQWWSLRALWKATRLLIHCCRADDKLARVIAHRQSIGFRSSLPKKKQRALAQAQSPLAP